MLTLSPFKLNGAMASRTPSPNVNFQGYKDKNNSMMQPDAARMGIQTQVKLVKSPKTQPRFGADNVQEQTDQARKERISRAMAEIKADENTLTNKQAMERIVKVTKSVGMHAFVHWVGKHITWVFEKLSNFVGVIKDFLKDKWEEVIDWLTN